MQETCVRSLGRKDPPEKEMATHSSILAWEITQTEESGGLQSKGSQRVGQDREREMLFSIFSCTFSPSVCLISIQILCPFLIGLFSFCRVLRASMYFRYKSCIRYVFAYIFSQGVACLMIPWRPWVSRKGNSCSEDWRDLLQISRLVSGRARKRAVSAQFFWAVWSSLEETVLRGPVGSNAKWWNIYL